MGCVPGGVGRAVGLEGGVLGGNALQIYFGHGSPILRHHGPDCDLTHIPILTGAAMLRFPLIACAISLFSIAESAANHNGNLFTSGRAECPESEYPAPRKRGDHNAWILRTDLF